MHTPVLDCLQEPTNWSLVSSNLGNASYEISDPTGCAPDIEFDNFITKEEGTKLLLQGGRATLHLVNTGGCDAKIVNIVVQLIQFGSSSDCSTDCSDHTDDQDNDENHDSDSCDLSRRGKVIAATAQESVAVYNCPNGRKSPAIACLSHGRSNKECLLNLPYNESAHLYDLNQHPPAILNLASYTVPKNTKCDHATNIGLGYEFALTSEQYALMQAQTSKRYIVKILITYDTCCGMGHVCGTDYDCDSIVEPIRTITLESSCFRLRSEPCEPQCDTSHLNISIQPVMFDPLSNSSTNLQEQTRDIDASTIVAYSYMLKHQGPVEVPQMCCDSLRETAGLLPKDNVSLIVTTTSCLTVDQNTQTCSTAPSDPICTHQETRIDCIYVRLDCEVSEWSEWSSCTIDCPAPPTRCDCAKGLQTRSRTITQSPNHPGSECPVLVETIPCRSECVFQYCRCPGPTGVCQEFPLPGSAGYNCQSPDQHFGDCPDESFTCEENVDCVVSEWGPFTPCDYSHSSDPSLCTIEDTNKCSSDCYYGRQMHMRDVVTPPQGSGSPCPPLSETTVCQNVTTLACLPCLVGGDPAGNEQCVVLLPANSTLCPYTEKLYCLPCSC